MSALTIRLPDELKEKAKRLAKKKKMSFNALVKYWLQAAVMQEETIAWMNKRMKGKNPERLIAEFGKFLEKTRPGSEPDLEKINQTLGR